MDSVGFADVQSEDELYDFDMDMDPPNWQQLVSREVLMGLKPYEIKRQEVINGEMEWRFFPTCPSSELKPSPGASKFLKFTIRFLNLIVNFKV